VTVWVQRLVASIYTKYQTIVGRESHFFDPVYTARPTDLETQLQPVKYKTRLLFSRRQTIANRTQTCFLLLLTLMTSVY